MNAQELTLSVKAERPVSQAMKDSLQMNTSFKDLLSLKKETDTLYLKMQRMGFIESELLQLQKENDSSYIADFFLGKKYNEISIFYSEEDFSKKELQRVASEITDTYFTLPFEAIPNSLRKLTTLRNQKGNAFARLRLSEFEKDENNNLSATLLVDNGNFRNVDSIAVKGYEKFPRSFLKYYAGIKKGEVFNQKKLVEQNENLNSLGFVSAIKPPEALFRKDSTTVYFYLEKQNNNLFDGIIGFATDEETQKLTFNGYLNLELNNNLNFGEQLLLNYKSDGKEQVNFRVKATLPYLFKSPIGLSGELKIFKRDSTFITTEQQLRATYQINPKSTIYLGYKGYDSSNLLDNAVAGSPVEDFKSNFLIAGGTYLKTQNKKLFPIKTILSLDGGVGSRKNDSITENQVRLEGLLSNIFNLNFKNSIFVQNSTSILVSDSYLVNELFRFGGINSIRGFNENSIDASFFSVVNTEYRYQFNEGVYLHSIIDFAYFENETLKLKQNLYSFGVGIGLNTKAGLFKFNVANGNTENQNFSFSNTKIHISVSSKF
ncbi:outer membrane protein/protective antigen OMA87 [Aequorivita sublithincola DSM 14238]|uniref:Outer membrane protein/protective antigen OMA87 n=2 Tax=Aequorivita TaxID=153265 RepID=I3YWK8_AEQSU|nr:outer membrane protein/protective antigen OMA87 [Aequorivita sublithincola DSM 14238]